MNFGVFKNIFHLCTSNFHIYANRRNFEFWSCGSIEKEKSSTSTRWPSWSPFSKENRGWDFFSSTYLKTFIFAQNHLMLDNGIIMGVNAPKPHQRIIGKLMMQLGILFYIKKTLPYEPLPETMIDENRTSPTPDILLFDPKSKQNMAIIEVSGNTGAKRDFEKVKELVEEYGVLEGFVYNYDLKTWRKYSLGTGEDLKRPTYSEVAKQDLGSLLD